MSKERSSDPKKRPPGKISPPIPGDFEELLQSYGLSAENQRAGKNPPAIPSDFSDFSDFLENYRVSAENQPWGKNPLPTGASGPLQELSGIPIPKVPPPARVIDLSRCRITSFREQGTVETFLSEERKIYPNNSRTATLTKEISVSNSVARTVTIEKSELKGNNAEAGVTLVGFAAIQAQVQRQLNQRYSVTTENSVTIGEKTTIAIPPASTVEHVIRWKLISTAGIAVLGETPRFSPSFDLAEVPYRVPSRLTYTETINDIPQVRRSGNG